MTRLEKPILICFGDGRRIRLLSAQEVPLPPAALSGFAHLCLDHSTRCDRRKALRRIHPGLLYMFEHIAEPLRVAEVQKLVGLSHSTFFCVFKQATGYSPKAFLTHLRIWCACRLLAGTSLSIKEISHRLGYGDPLHFSRAFRSAIGVAPRMHRANLVNAAAPGHQEVTPVERTA
jgi:AraC-like DNA-binding protein